MKLKKKFPLTPTGTLAKLWYQILVNTGYIHQGKLKSLRNSYLDRIKHSSRGRKHTSNTLTNDVSATEMSFKTFMDLVTKFLPSSEVTFCVIIKDKHTKKESTHTVTLEVYDEEADNIETANKEDRKKGIKKDGKT